MKPYFTKMAIRLLFAFLCHYMKKLYTFKNGPVFFTHPVLMSTDIEADIEKYHPSAEIVFYTVSPPLYTRTV